MDLEDTCICTKYSDVTITKIIKQYTLQYHNLSHFIYIIKLQKRNEYLYCMKLWYSSNLNYSTRGLQGDGELFKRVVHAI